MLRENLRDLGAELAAFLLAANCPGCDAPGQLLCEACRNALSAAPVEVSTPDGLAVRAALPYGGVAARCIRRLKGEGETLLARPLGAALAVVLTDAIGPPGAGVRAVPVPTGRAAFRRRGYRVPDLLLRQAGAEPLRILGSARAAADQRGLGVRERAANVRGSMRVRGTGGGRRVVLVDDVITTGATLDEAARVLRAAGFRVSCAVALAATPRHAALTSHSSTIHR